MEVGAVLALRIIVLGLLVAACGIVPGLGVPEADINGVSGDTVSHCWANTCADGVLGGDHPALPADAPYQLKVTSTIRSVTVEVTDGSRREPVAVNDDLVLGPLPEGDWKYLIVFAQFEPNGDALYAWSVR